jgi:hypothetical protein
MGAVCRPWEPCSVDYTIMELHVLYGSHIHHIRAATTFVRRMVSSGGRMMGAMWKLSVLGGSCVCHIGARWHHVGGTWHHMEAACAM